MKGLGSPSASILWVRWSSQLLLQCYPCLLSHTSYNDGHGLTLGKSRSSSSTTFPRESYRNIHSSQVERAPTDRHQFCVPPAWQTRALTGVSTPARVTPETSPTRVALPPLRDSHTTSYPVPNTYTHLGQERVGIGIPDYSHETLLLLP